MIASPARLPESIPAPPPDVCVFASCHKWACRKCEAKKFHKQAEIDAGNRACRHTHPRASKTTALPARLPQSVPSNPWHQCVQTRITLHTLPEESIDRMDGGNRACSRKDERRPCTQLLAGVRGAHLHGCRNLFPLPHPPQLRNSTHLASRAVR
jgi:hypothetical protein